MTNSLAPFDAVLVVSFGGPNGPDEVMPFLRNVAAGRHIPEDRLAEVATHYHALGGVSPIVANTDEFVAALTTALRERGVDVPVVLGCRNWHPFLTDALGRLHDAGARQILVLLTSAYASYSGCRQYREDLARAVAELGPRGAELTLAKIAPFHASAGWVDAQVEALAPALDDPRRTKILFTTHSIPTAMAALAGPGGSRDYVAQHRDTARLVTLRLAELARGSGQEPAARAGQQMAGPARRAETLDWEVVYCSRSGSPRTPWLTPDVADRIRELPTTDPDVERVVVVPFGFLNDHMEVVNDLDHDAAAAAAEVGLAFVRTPTVHVQEAFLTSLVDRLLARAAEARGEVVALDALGPEWPTTCAADCCLPRPDAPTVPTVCQENR